MPLTETHKIPQIAFSAFRLAASEYQRQLNVLSTQAVSAMGFDPDAPGETWNVNFSTGVATRVIADPPAPAGPVAPEAPAAPAARVRRPSRQQRRAAARDASTAGAAGTAPTAGTASTEAPAA